MDLSFDDKAKILSRTKALKGELMKNPCVKEAFEKLDNLPAELCYHNKQHTSEVLHDALMFAMIDGEVSKKEMELLGIAAAFHDTGFVVSSKENEPIGAKFAEKSMRKHRYSEEDISQVKLMILDTQLKPVTENGKFTLRQFSNSTLSGFLLDADVSNFGRRDFPIKTDLVYTETKAQDPVKFFSFVEGLLSSHSWQTEAAAAVCQVCKNKNIENVKERLSRLSNEMQIKQGVSLPLAAPGM